MQVEREQTDSTDTADKGDKKRKRSSTSSVAGDISVKAIDSDIVEKYSPTQTKSKKKRKCKPQKKSTMDSSGGSKSAETIDIDIGSRLDSIVTKLDSIVTKEEIVEIVKHTFQTEMESLVERIKDQVYKSVTHRIDVIEGEVHKTNQELDECKTTIKKLEHELHTKDDTIDQMMRTMESNKGKCANKGNEMEQYSRINNIKIINLPEETTERLETSEQTTEKVVNFLNEKMNTNIQTKDIDIAHRIGRKEGNKPRTAIVRFISRRHKFQSMKDRKVKLRGTGIYIVEDLTRMNQSVFTAARNNVDVESCWTRNGQTMVKWKANQKIEQIEFKDYVHWLNRR